MRRSEMQGRARPAEAHRRPDVWIAFWLGVPLMLLLATGLGGLRLNLTGSLPVGLYAITGGAPTRGTLVLVCLPRPIAEFARERGYVPHGRSCPGGVMALGKPVFAISGDTVVVGPDGLILDGRRAANSRSLAADRQARPLVGLPNGRYIVGPGELWVVSGYSGYSFDSRYFGPVPVSSVRARLRSIWTVKSAGVNYGVRLPA